MAKKTLSELDAELGDFITEANKHVVKIEVSPPSPKLEPHEWAEKLGNFRGKDSRLPQSQDFFTPAHAAADFLHGWSKHRHHFQSAPLLITQADYEAALEAAGGYPVTQPCEAALSPVSQVALARARAKAEAEAKAKAAAEKVN